MYMRRPSNPRSIQLQSREELIGRMLVMIIMMMTMGTRNSVSVTLNSSPLHIILVVADLGFFEKKRCMAKLFAQVSFNARIIKLHCCLPCYCSLLQRC
jgi:hypothetical protein